MRQTLLTDQQAQFLREEKESLAGIQHALANLELPAKSPPLNAMKQMMNNQLRILATKKWEAIGPPIFSF